MYRREHEYSLLHVLTRRCAHPVANRGRAPVSMEAPQTAVGVRGPAVGACKC